MSGRQKTFNIVGGRVDDVVERPRNLGKSPKDDDDASASGAHGPHGFDIESHVGISNETSKN